MLGKNTYKKFIIPLALCLAFSWGINSYADTTQDKLNNTADRIDALQQQKEDKENELAGLNDYKTKLTGDLGELDTQLYNISVELDHYAEQIADADNKIAEKETDIAAMEEKSDRQYEDMKKRIKYSYENGQDSVFTILLSSDSIADFLNRSEYATAITNYDRKMLDSYVATLHEIETQKAELEASREELTALQQQEEDKKEQVGTLIAEKQNMIQSANEQISEASDALADYENELEQQRAYEAQLEEQKAKEDAARLEEIRRQEAQENLNNVTIVPAEAAAANSGTASAPVSVAAGDQALLAALIYCEAGGESYEGQLAVGSVVMNRVRSQAYPNSVSGVIYQGGQFSPVASGRYATVLARGAESSCVQAARDVLAGNRTIGALYFRRNTGTIEGTVIGNHVFY